MAYCSRCLCGICRLAYLGASGMAAAHHRSDLLNEELGDESVCCCLIFPAGISRGREVVGQGGRNRSNWLALCVRASSTKRTDRSCGEEVFICQPSPVSSPQGSGHSRFEKRLSVSNTPLAFSICTRKLYSVRLVKGHFRHIRSGLIGSAGIFISRSWMIGFGRR